MMRKVAESRTVPWTRIIYGEPASKANSRTITTIGGKPRSIKSKKALRYLEDFHRQCPFLDPMFEGNVHVDLRIYYASRRPDLDESVILDAMQGRIYKNDRQVKIKHVEWGLDPDNPRAEIKVQPCNNPTHG
jgi:Holliday junction resolvase RusA-like endonuclease